MADTFPIDQGDSRGARAELIPAPLYTAAEAAEQQQAADCETLRATRERSHSESDRIAYALDMVLITHPGCCSRKTDGGQS